VKGAIAIFNGIKDHKCLKKIDLSHNGIETDVGKAFQELLIHNKTLEEINLKNNR
jgi:Ran GTPase-activating protein (RanGAP) involved in mRNA processing and transport